MYISLSKAPNSLPKKRGIGINPEKARKALPGTLTSLAKEVL